MRNRKRSYTVLIEDDDEHIDEENTTYYIEDHDQSDDDDEHTTYILVDSDDPPRDERPNYGHFSPMLCAFFLRLHEEGIKAVEWGEGLTAAMGAPVSDIDKMILVPTDQLEDVLHIASTLFPAVNPEYNMYGVVGELAHWFTVPDQPHDVATQTPSLLILDARDVELNINRTHFIPEYNIWRPGLTEAFQSFVHFVCMHGDSQDTSAVEMWINNFVLYTVCGVQHLENGTDEDEEDEDQEGLARIPTLDWTDETRWLEDTLRQLVKGELTDDVFTLEWWEDHVR